ncbi:hypothetical protein DAEQUDRAFT_729738 [Daedalea quercina L-15889]|uniref:Uncharacterized protein n=1 Tax=Daedalea quercina L-15889 TaxID=1314783 RepID=A0A165NGH7_9APHY|nr:hypothetical protein DAEQUDRAFT_729738 [Daedalea quercina L-15889]
MEELRLSTYLQPRPDESDATPLNRQTYLQEIPQQYVMPDCVEVWHAPPQAFSERFSLPSNSEAYDAYGISVNLPPSLPHSIKMQIAAYCHALTSGSPCLPLTDEDILIANLIYGRMQKLGGRPGNAQNAPSSNVTPIHVGIQLNDSPMSPPPYSALPDVIATDRTRCLFDGCDEYYPSSSVSDIATHLRERHFNECSKEAWNGEERTVCRWLHCSKDRPLLRRHLAKHIRDVHLRDERVACIYTQEGCRETFSRQDGMIRHSKKCPWNCEQA